MFSNAAGWALAVSAVTAIWLVVLLRKGPVTALGIAVVLSFAFPVWLKFEIVGLPFGVRTTVAAVAMIGYAVHPSGKIISPLTLLDLCVAMMVVVHVLADSMATGLTTALPLRAYGEWALPYIAGRFAIRDCTDLPVIARAVLGVLVLLGLMSCVEAVTRINPFELIFGERPLEGFPRTVSRLGLKRSYGTVLHPIFYGMLIFGLMPWLTAFFTSHSARALRVAAAIAVLVSAAGVTATVSRIPFFAMSASTAVLLAVWYRWLRWPVALTASVAVACIILAPEQTVDKLSRWTGGGDRASVVDIDGKAANYSSSRNRLLIVRAYGDALRFARMTGYGTEATSTFPPRIPYLQSETLSVERLRNVDNAFVLIALRFGWLGMSVLLLMLIAGVGTAFRLYSDRPDQNLIAGLGCMLAILIPTLLLTWMSYDFGLMILWTLGILAGLSSAQIQSRLQHRRVL
jgi:hypothetical protein